MKKRMKQLTALTLTTALILTAVSGCGSSDKNESTASGSSASGGQYLTRILLSKMSLPRQHLMVKLETGALEINMKFWHFSPNTI